MASCDIYHKIPQGKLLLKKNTIIADSTEEKSDRVNGLILKKPNPAILTGIYMMADQHPDATYYNWIKGNKTAYKLLKKMISRKQIVQLQYYYKDVNKLVKSVGNPPVYLDTTSVRKSVKKLHFYYVSHSYLDAQSSYKIDTLKRKRASVTYQIKKFKPYIIDSIYHDISSKSLEQVYNRYLDESHIHTGKPYNRDDFVSEKERLSNLFRNKGFYHFQPSYINYDLIFDGQKKRHKLSAHLNIPNRSITKEDSVYTAPFLPYRVRNINIYISKQKNFDLTQKKDSARIDSIRMYATDDKLRYRPKLLANSIFVKPGDLYSDTDRLRTHRFLMSLQNFKQAYIQFTENPKDTTLTGNIYLIPEKRFSWQGTFDLTHSNIHNLGLKGGTSFSAKNLFKGAEILNTSLYLMLASSKTLKTNDYKFNVKEFGTDVTLKFPKLLLPFGLSKYIPRYMVPKTYLTFIANKQVNIGLDRSKYAGIFGFEWKPIKERKYKIDVLNYEFITNNKKEKYFNIYTLSYDRVNDIAQQLGENNLTPETAEVYKNSLLNDPIFEQQHPDLYRELKVIDEREQRITQNIFILSNKFEFNYDSRKNILQRHFYLVNTNFEFAGTILSPFVQLLKFQKNDLGAYTVNSVPYAEYFRTDLSYIRHWQLSKHQILAYRAFLGFAVPYGNSKSIPFVSSFFAGGSNDIRAWRAYTLGPGTSGGPNEFNEANFKLTTNLEYRFPIISYFKGAVFADAGNIWNVYNDETNPLSSFHGLSSLKDVALGTGFGLRIDFTYFILRVDLGYKTYDPAKEINQRWINLKETKFTDGTLNLGISYPF